jgi:DNA-directed RNA polymerase sigma subunit (sigma70/sigma32)
MRSKEGAFRREEKRVTARNGSFDSLRLYFQEIRAANLLTPDEEKVLARRTAQGDDAARKRMIESNLRLVVMVDSGIWGKVFPSSI